MHVASCVWPSARMEARFWLNVWVCVRTCANLRMWLGARVHFRGLLGVPRGLCQAFERVALVPSLHAVCYTLNDVKRHGSVLSALELLVQRELSVGVGILTCLRLGSSMLRRCMISRPPPSTCSPIDPGQAGTEPRPQTKGWFPGQQPPAASSLLAGSVLELTLMRRSHVVG